MPRRPRSVARPRPPPRRCPGRGPRPPGRQRARGVAGRERQPGRGEVRVVVEERRVREHGRHGARQGAEGVPLKRTRPAKRAKRGPCRILPASAVGSILGTRAGRAAPTSSRRRSVPRARRRAAPAASRWPRWRPRSRRRARTASPRCRGGELAGVVQQVGQPGEVREPQRLRHRGASPRGLVKQGGPDEQARPGRGERQDGNREPGHHAAGEPDRPVPPPARVPDRAPGRGR